MCALAGVSRAATTRLGSVEASGKPACVTRFNSWLFPIGTATDRPPRSRQAVVARGVMVQPRAASLIRAHYRGAVQGHCPYLMGCCAPLLAAPASAHTWRCAGSSRVIRSPRAACRRRHRNRYGDPPPVSVDTMKDSPPLVAPRAVSAWLQSSRRRRMPRPHEASATAAGGRKSAVCRLHEPDAAGIAEFATFCRRHCVESCRRHRGLQRTAFLLWGSRLPAPCNPRRYGVLPSQGPSWRRLTSRAGVIAPLRIAKGLKPHLRRPRDQQR